MESSKFVKNSSSAEIGTSRASMNRTGKTTAAKGVHNNYNEYKEFHEREIEPHICASFMQMVGMKKFDGLYHNYQGAFLLFNTIINTCNFTIIYFIISYIDIPDLTVPDSNEEKVAKKKRKKRLISVPNILRNIF